MLTTQELIAHLDLKTIDKLTFEGENVAVGSPNVFGGQVLAQAVNAGYKTITNNRVLHSLHAYFLEAGNLALPIQYKVDVMRDGGSFSTRRVTAKQGEKVIFILACSFHKHEEGYEHQITMPEGVKPPEELMSWEDLAEQFGEFLPKYAKSFLQVPRPIAFKPTEIVNPMDLKDMNPYTNVWFKLKEAPTAMDLKTKQEILTYISDYNILSSAMQRHASQASWSNTMTASLDHSMWFFDDFGYDDWMLYALDTPSTQNARGFCRGNIFTRNGKLIASVTQEGLIRPIKKK